MAEINWESLDGAHLKDALEQYSIENGISDIHLSPEKDFARLEVRHLGVLQLLGHISHEAVVQFARSVKFAAKLKLNITNIPQDGQYTFEAPGRVVNVRTATIPSRFGEKYTLRLLDPKKGIVPLDQLGFPEVITSKLAELINLPNGLILVTGPTGSGKTTTLYALLQTIVGKSRNIITLENPIEYEIPGIVQSQVDFDHDFTFATGLRSILRHDPDVVLVGEIRDFETAQTAVDAALTGHLVLSTIHTNSAVEAIPRLLSMGVSPYTFAPSLRGILGQRLVRTLSDECKADGANCNPLDPNTYQGQMSLPELLVVTSKVRQLILDNEPAQVILDELREEGYFTMRDWGEKYIEQGFTTKSEVMRVSM